MDMTSHANVVSHLMYPDQEEGELGQEVMTQTQAEKLVAKYPVILQDGIRCASAAYYTALMMLRAEAEAQKTK